MIKLLSKRLFVTFLFASFLISCKVGRQDTYYLLNGFTQGTSYAINFETDNKPEKFQHGIDSILNKIDSSLSLYSPDSKISKINGRQENKVDIHLRNVLLKAIEVADRTDGAFDFFTPASIDNDFESEDESEMASFQDDLDTNSKVELAGDVVFLPRRSGKLNLNAIAQGYTVDVIAAYLESSRLTNYLIEIGGEVRGRGESSKGLCWLVGIEEPSFTSAKRQVRQPIELCNKSIATSGIYRNYQGKKDRVHSHIIDPATGVSVMNEMVSATVLADDCMTADAYATAFMVMGLNRIQEFLKIQKSLDVYLIYQMDSTSYGVYMSDGMKGVLKENSVD